MIFLGGIRDHIVIIYLHFTENMRKQSATTMSTLMVNKETLVTNQKVFYFSFFPTVDQFNTGMSLTTKNISVREKDEYYKWRPAASDTYLPPLNFLQFGRLQQNQCY
jgi:hypothetical protein